jgi:hypothetical protein
MIGSFATQLVRSAYALATGATTAGLATAAIPVTLTVWEESFSTKFP